MCLDVLSDFDSLKKESSQELPSDLSLNPKPKDLIKSGFLSFLNQEAGLEETNHNPIVEFERWFLKYHDACLLTRWTWNRKNNYVYIEPIGVYTNLNTLAKRIRNELQKRFEEKYNIKLTDETRKWKPSVEFYSETLHISLPEEELDENDICIYSQELEVSYITFNDTDPNRGYEGWKFDINFNKSSNDNL